VKAGNGVTSLAMATEGTKLSADEEGGSSEMELVLGSVIAAKLFVSALLVFDVELLLTGGMWEEGGGVESLPVKLGNEFEIALALR
jgi:hypothetical protein